MIRFGIAGFGLHAVKRLMPGFVHSKKCRVTALSRRDIAAAKQSAADFKIPHAFDSIEELCNSKDVDAVFVATPNFAHLKDVLTSIRARKPVLCEKPLAMNSDECRQMVEAARASNVLFGVAHIFRFEESVNRIRELVASGTIGNVIFARSEFSFMADPSHPRKWLYDATIAGAGPIFDIGAHCIDTLRFVLQDEIVSVTANAVSDDRSGSVESAASLGLKFSRGTLGSVLVSYRAQYRTPLELVGRIGVISAQDALNVEYPIDIQVKREGAKPEVITVANPLSYAIQVDAFADAIEGKSRFPASGEEGWQNQEVLDAALRSVKSGKAEAVPQVKSS